MNKAQTWKTLSCVDVTPYIKKKGGLDYLPWAVAHSLMMAHCPDYTVSEPVEHALPDGTMETSVTVTIGDWAHTQRLPVMDHRNKAVAIADANLSSV